MLRRWIKQTKGIGIRAVSIMLALALVASACAPVAAAPAEKVVKFGLRACLTGPGASTTLYAHYGQFDYVKYINEQGGIDGVKLEWVWEDCRAQAPKSISAHRRFKAGGVLFESEPIVVGVEATLSALQRDEVPLVYLAQLSSGMISKPQWVCAFAPSNATEFASFMKWVKDNWTKERPPRIGMLQCDSGTGWEAFEGSKHASEVGVEFVGHEVIPFLVVLDVSTELLRLEAKKPDWIYVASYGSPLVVVIKDAARLELHKKGIKLITVAAGIDEIIVRTAGKDAEGWYRTSFQPSTTETELPGLKVIVEAAKKYRGLEPEEVPGHYAAGWCLTQIMGKAVRVAIEEVGFDNLSGRAIRNALFSIKDFETGYFPPITITEEKPFCRKFPAYTIYQVQNGRIMRYSKGYEAYFVYDFG